MSKLFDMINKNAEIFTNRLNSSRCLYVEEYNKLVTEENQIKDLESYNHFQFFSESDGESIKPYWSAEPYFCMVYTDRTYLKYKEGIALETLREDVDIKIPVRIHEEDDIDKKRELMNLHVKEILEKGNDSKRDLENKRLGKTRWDSFKEIDLANESYREFIRNNPEYDYEY